ncbi:MAG: sialidase family protein [Phycisphaerae bacterium]
MHRSITGCIALSAIWMITPNTLYSQTQPPPRPSTRAPERLDDPPGVPAQPLPYDGSPRIGPPARGAFAPVQVNVDANGMNVPGDAANEPSIAVDPTDPNRMAIGWRQFDTINSNFRQAGVAFTIDGGLSWTFPGVLDPGQFRSDPVLGSDADGNFYYCSLSSVTTAEVFKSIDGGITWMPPVTAHGGDKEWMVIDQTLGIGSGNIYEIWNVQFSCCPPNDFTRSTDGGGFFQPPIAIPQPSMKWGTMSVGPDGALYLAGATLNQTGHLIARSTTAQDTASPVTFDFVSPVNLGGVTVTGGPNPAGLLGQVSIATDHSGGPTHGNVYILGSVDPPGLDPLNVMFTRSTDGGVSWSTPVRVNDDLTMIGDGAWNWFGTMSVAPNGRIDVVWNDTRNDPVPVPTMSELFYSYSIDAGMSWSRSIPLTQPYNHTLGYPQQNKMGDYYHMVSLDSAAKLAFAATFNGEQDVYFLSIAPDCNNNGIHDGTELLDGTGFDCNHNGTLDDCEFPGCPGIPLADTNCDGSNDGGDVQRFVDLMVTGGYTCSADMNQDGVLDAGDLPDFVGALLVAP